ncbi:hypothetical protein ACVPSA_18005 [Salmonella enterica subsp. enterica serovar Enteritidis]
MTLVYSLTSESLFVCSLGMQNNKSAPSGHIAVAAPVLPGRVAGDNKTATRRSPWGGSHAQFGRTEYGAIICTPNQTLCHIFANASAEAGDNIRRVSTEQSTYATKEFKILFFISKCTASVEFKL